MTRPVLTSGKIIVKNCGWDLLPSKDLNLVSPTQIWNLVPTVTYSVPYACTQTRTLKFKMVPWPRHEYWKTWIQARTKPKNQAVKYEVQHVRNTSY